MISIIPDRDAAGNYIIPVTNHISNDPIYSLATFGLKFTATLNTTTNYDKLMTKAYGMHAGVMFIKNSTFGDYLNVQIIDKDNVLGYGNNVVLKQYINEWYVWEGRAELHNLTVGDLPAAGLYLRLIYNSVGTTGNVPEIIVNLISYEKTV
jgi:hypothetical protein